MNDRLKRYITDSKTLKTTGEVEAFFEGYSYAFDRIEEIIEELKKEEKT